MENNIEYWKKKIQKESGIPPHFFAIINNQELENDLLKLQIQLEQTKNKILKYEKR